MDTQIRCPHCGEVFTVDESGYAAILSQVRDKEFRREVDERVHAAEAAHKDKVRLAVSEAEGDLKSQVAELEKQLEALKAQQAAAQSKEQAERQLAVERAEAAQRESRLAVERERDDLRSKLALERDGRERDKVEFDARLKERLAAKDELIADREREIERIQDMRARLSTKMVGESLERHCEAEFNRLRPTAFPKAYFEKDNEVVGGTKGDFVFRDFDEDGNEYISIMFEMKNESETSTNRKTNESHFKKLDSDRRKKGCEYAVLVSLLEPESELYNAGIVDVSYRYDKMYVIRPQFFIPMITLLRNAARSSLEYRRELELARRQNIDVTNFENDLNDFKDKFGRNYRLASEKFDKAIEEIDKSIQHLQKVRDSLLGSQNNLRLANDKAEKLTVKRLVSKNPTMKEMFDEARAAETGGDKA